MRRSRVIEILLRSSCICRNFLRVESPSSWFSAPRDKCSYKYNFHRVAIRVRYNFSSIRQQTPEFSSNSKSQHQSRITSIPSRRIIYIEEARGLLPIVIEHIVHHGRVADETHPRILLLLRGDHAVVRVFRCPSGSGRCGTSARSGRAVAPFHDGSGGRRLGPRQGHRSVRGRSEERHAMDMRQGEQVWRTVP